MMSGTETQPGGGIVLAFERHSQALVELLVLRLRNRMGITQYAHPYEVECSAQHDFIIVLSRADLAGVVKACKAKNCTPPLLVHVDAPEVIAGLDYAKLYPGVEIVSIEQQNLTNQPEETLSLTLFRDIIECLEKRKSSQ